MEKWIIIALLATIGITALLIGVLYRANAPMLRKQSGDDGGAHVYGAPGGGGRAQRQDGTSDSSSDSGGGDGGGD